MIHRESVEGRSLLEWCFLHRRTYPELDPEGCLFFHIPNGEARDARAGARLKAEGVVRGIPDYFLAVPRGPFHGMFLELKAPGGRLSKTQWHAQNRLRDAGYAVRIGYGFEDARDRIVEYLEQKDRVNGSR